jgi:hypothetical protein
MSNDTLGREKRAPRPKWWPKMSHCRDRATVAYRAAENMARQRRDSKAPREGGRGKEVGRNTRGATPSSEAATRPEPDYLRKVQGHWRIVAKGPKRFAAGSDERAREPQRRGASATDLHSKDV